MYLIDIVDVSGTHTRGYVEDREFSEIYTLITKKRFWKNKIVSFRLYSRKSISNWEFKHIVILRNKNIVRFMYERHNGVVQRYS